MSKIAILTDSSCDIPQELAEKYSIDIMGFHILLDDVDYVERESCTNAEFYEKMRAAKGIPSTAAITPLQFCEKYCQYVDEGYTDVIHVPINRSGSSTYNNAVMAQGMLREERPEHHLKIHLLDPHTYSMPFGWYVCEMARKLKNGAEISHVIHEFEAQMDKIEIVLGDAIYQNLSFLKSSHEPYVVIASGDGIYKLDYNKVLEYHIEKKADVTVVCADMADSSDMERFGTIKMNEECRIEEFEEKPLLAKSNIVSCGIYVIRRRQLIEMIEQCAREDRYDFVKDILIRYKDIKKIYGYKMKEYWRNIASVEDYYKTNMDFLKPEIRDYFFRQYPDIYSKVDDLPPAKYNPGSQVRNSLISSGCIINGTVEDSVIFKKAYIGNNCYIKNSIILNDVYIGDNTHIENCIVESRDTIRANTYHKGEDEIKIVTEQGDRFVI